MKFTNKKALDVSKERCARAKQYADLFPDRISPNDLRFQDLEWQYVNEGLKSVQPVESKIER